jgi:hypothetical protein
MALLKCLVIPANVRTLARAMHPTDSVETAAKGMSQYGGAQRQGAHHADIQPARDDPIA